MPVDPDESPRSFVIAASGVAMQNAYDDTMSNTDIDHASVIDVTSVGRMPATENMRAAPSERL